MADVLTISRGEERYPQSAVALLGDAAPDRIYALGDPGLLDRPLLAFFCSSKCPGSVILQTYDTVCALRDAGVAVIGGFHSPIEQEALRLLLRGTQPIAICPARGIDHMRVPVEWREPLAQGRLLVLSPFDRKVCRPTRELAHERNRFVAALASRILIAHVDPGGSNEALLRETAAWGKPVMALEEALAERQSLP